MMDEIKSNQNTQFLERSSHSTSAKILIVNDKPDTLNLLFAMLRQRGFTPHLIQGGRSALQAMELEPPDLVLLNANLPEMDGYEVCQAIKSNPRLKEIPVIFISAPNETLDKVKAFSTGGVDTLTQPFQADEVYARIETQLRVRRLQLALRKVSENLGAQVQAQVKDVSGSQMATIFALAKLAESRDDVTGKHLERVRIYCRLLAEHLSHDPTFASRISNEMIDTIYDASPLYDIGKVAIPDRILLKAGRLNDQEFEVMKQHTILGANALEAVALQYSNNKMVMMAIEITRCHHEWWDGSGYPAGLAGEAIPISARITTIADVYDALRSKRAYRPPYSHEDACAIIYNSRETFLDPAIETAFSQLNTEFKTISTRFASDP